MRKSILAVGLATMAISPWQLTGLAQAATGVSKVSSVDFNGDGKSDYAVARANGTQITFYTSALGAYSEGNWGLSGTDTILACDFDGDGKDDHAVWRTGAPSVARFYILQSSTNTVREEAFGQTGDDPTVSADYDGDGKCDPAVYRAGANPGDPSFFYYRGSLNNLGGNVTYVPWGLNGDFPTAGDYDGDGKYDFAIQRAGVFWIKTATGSTSTIAFGGASDFIIRGDYDGDGKSDLALRRTVSGRHTYFIRNSSNGSIQYGLSWGLTGWNSVPGDYDGDGKTDLAEWNPTTGAFWVQNSVSGTTVFTWGKSGDFPLAGALVN